MQVGKFLPTSLRSCVKSFRANCFWAKDPGVERFPYTVGGNMLANEVDADHVMVARRLRFVHMRQRSVRKVAGGL